MVHWHKNYYSRPLHFRKFSLFVVIDKNIGFYFTLNFWLFTLLIELCLFKYLPIDMFCFRMRPLWRCSVQCVQLPVWLGMGQIIPLLLWIVVFIRSVSGMFHKVLFYKLKSCCHLLSFTLLCQSDFIGSELCEGLISKIKERVVRLDNREVSNAR